MTHVFSQLTPLVTSYPAWIALSGILWVSGHLTQRGEGLRMLGALAIVVAAAMYLMH